MQIVSINTRHTVDHDTVAFNVVQILDPTVFATIDFEGLKVRLEDGLLYVQTPHEPLDKATVQRLNELLDAARVESEARAVAADQAHQKLLSELTADLGIPLDEKKA